jgi:hypothetical protein
MIGPVFAALTDVSATLGLVFIFLVLFPALAHVLIGFAVAQVLGERNENQRYKKRSGSQGRGIGSSQG